MKTYIGTNFDENICLKKCIYPGSSCGLVCRICPPKYGSMFGKLVEVTATEPKMPLKLSWLRHGEKEMLLIYVTKYRTKFILGK